MESNLNMIKKYYKEKKKTWALKKTYYAEGGLWGDEYGYELAKPYTIEEVEEAEKEFGEKYPTSLVIYLTQVSREIFADSYPVIFGLPTDDDDIDPLITEKDSMGEDDGMYWTDEEEELYEKTKKELKERMDNPKLISHEEVKKRLNL